MEEEEKPHSNNAQEKSVKHYKGSSIQTSHNTLQDNTDWISRLPDSLLLRILSRFKLEEVKRTSLLSKRWRYLWMSFPSLDFTFLKKGKKIKKTTFINWFLFHHDESKVDELRIQIEYEEKHAKLVDSWILFAARHGVEVLKLDLFDGYSPEGLELSSDYTLYKLPHSLFRCGSLTYLELCGCDLNLPATFQLTSLEILYLKYIDLDPFAIEHVTSNCPLLSNLHLDRCNKSIDLNICITNDKIRCLTITEDENYELNNSITTIYAPNLFSLSFSGLPRTNYHFQQLSLLRAVSFHLFSDKYHVQDVLYGEDTGCDFTQLLHDLRYVENFGFDTVCIQALTAKEIRGLDPVSINATCISISSVFTKWELPGIAYLLKSASYLERLEISCRVFRQESVLDLTDEFLEENDFEEKDFWKLREHDSLSILQKTKTIRISVMHGCSTLVKDYNNWEKLFEFMRFLLKTSKVLERMTIIPVGRSENNVELMHEITRKVTSFPKASPNVGIVYDDKYHRCSSSKN